jgi:mRNA degradation ribonuclease J1/J2
MATEQTQKTEEMQPETVKFLSLGGEEDVTRNMYLYEHKDQILIVDCGLERCTESLSDKLLHF